MDYGKIPPQDIKMEMSLLASILLMGNSVLDDIGSIFKPEIFYKNAHQIIASAIIDLLINHENIDVITVTDTLRKKQVLDDIGGDSYLYEIIKWENATADPEYYAKAIYEKHIYRELIALAHDISVKSYDASDDVFDLIGNFQTRLISLTDFKQGNIIHINDSLKSLYSLIERNQKGANKITGVPTGIKEFDRHSGGLQGTDLIVIAGETSQGKTALALNIAYNASYLNYPTVIYSYEMSSVQLTARMLSRSSHVNSNLIQYGKLKNEELTKINDGINRLTDIPLYIDDIDSTDYAYLETSIRSMVSSYGIKLVVIDYLQLISQRDRSAKKHDGVAQIANDLKKLAKSLNVPIILVSQLSRNPDPKPKLGRLKGSGDIENAADVVWLIWRPSEYGMETFECLGEEYYSKSAAYHIIAKGRNIGTTEFVTSFDKYTSTFYDYTPQGERGIAINNDYIF